MNASDFFKERLNVYKSQLLDNKLQDSFANQMMKNARHSDYKQKVQEDYKQTNLKSAKSKSSSLSTLNRPELLAPYNSQFLNLNSILNKKAPSNKGTFPNPNAMAQNYSDLRSLKQKVKRRI